MSLIESSWLMSATQFFSRNSRTVLLERPIEFACWDSGETISCCLNGTLSGDKGDEGTDLPGAEDAAWLSEVETRRGVVVVEPDDEACDSEWSHSSTLSVFLREFRKKAG